jgi:DNA-binding LytR/AlgR family response regulator
VSISVLLVEDEPELLERLARHLQASWPGIELLPSAHNGDEAIALALKHLPQVIFLDIHLPGCSGLDAAETILEDWPEDRELPQLVFVTAYNQYALQAFEHAAVDYLLKPVSAERLRKTIERLQQRLRVADVHTPGSGGDTVGKEIQRLAAAIQPAAPAGGRLTVITAAIGHVTHLIPLQEVLYFEAAEKYLRVVTKGRDALIRLPLRELLARIDPEQFWQIHRSIVVQVAHISHVERTEEGRLHLCLHQHSARLAVSRLYAHRFKAM